MATKKQRYVSPIGTFDYAWISTPSKFDSEKGHSVRADAKDLNAKYSITVTIEPRVFEESDFKKQVDAVWNLAQEEHDGKYDAINPPYSQDGNGNYILKPTCMAAFQDKQGDVKTIHPVALDCNGKDITDFLKNEGIRVADSSVGRVYVTTYSGKPYKAKMGPDAGKKLLSMKLDLKTVQFKRLDRSENSGGAEAIEDGVPVAEDYGDAIPI